MQELQETWVQSLGREDLLGEEMATHSSILARVIPWTERGTWRVTFHGVTESRTHIHTKRLSTHTSK